MSEKVEADVAQPPSGMVGEEENMKEKKHKTVASTLADPLYKAGRKLLDEGRLEDAVDFFGGLLETRVQILHGDEMNPSLAPLYYEYGNSLLYNAEESGAVFGDAITDAEKQKAMAIIENQIAGGTQSGEGGAAGGGSSANGGAGGAGSGAPDDEEVAPSLEQGAEDDLELAWENLEMARRIYSGLELTEEIRTVIAKVHLRLGDLNMVNGMYAEAADEFEKCLEHRSALPNTQSRGMADAHVRRAQALFYASTLEGADKTLQGGMAKLSLEQYRLAAGIFEAMLASSKGPQASASPGRENSGDSSSAGMWNGNSKKGKGKGKESAAASAV